MVSSIYVLSSFFLHLSASCHTLRSCTATMGRFKAAAMHQNRMRCPVMHFLNMLVILLPILGYLYFDFQAVFGITMDI